jgi:hypothetical protein
VGIFFLFILFSSFGFWRMVKKCRLSINVSPCGDRIMS